MSLNVRTFSSAYATLSNAAKTLSGFGACAALPLLGERDGVRAVVILCWLITTTLSLRAAPLNWQTNGAARSAALPIPASGKAGFTSMTEAATGVAFTNQLPQWRHLTNQVLMNGGGVAFGDVDADGWCDVFLCNLTGASALYRNLGGWRFTNVAATTGVE